MAMYDFGGGKDSLLSNFVEFHLASGEADKETGSGGSLFGRSCANKKNDADTTSERSLSPGTILFLLFCIIGLYLQIKYY